MYNTFFTFHFFGSICVFSAAAITFLNMMRMVFSKETKVMWVCSYWAMNMGKLWFFSIVLILFSSIYLSFSRWGWKFPWIDVSFVILIVMLVLCHINLRRLIEIHQAVDAEANDVPSFTVMEKARNQNFWNSLSIMAVLVAGIIHLMIEKLGTIGSLLTFCITLIMGFLLSKAVLHLAHKLNPLPVVNSTGEKMPLSESVNSQNDHD
jgi:hypothetical protein